MGQTNEQEHVGGIIIEGHWFSPSRVDGLLCRHARVSGFKLALVVGYANVADKIRVRIWRANSRKWTQPQLVKIGELRVLTDADRVRHRSVIDLARSMQS